MTAATPPTSTESSSASFLLFSLTAQDLYFFGVPQHKIIENAPLPRPNDVAQENGLKSWLKAVPVSEAFSLRFRLKAPF